MDATVKKCKQCGDNYEITSKELELARKFEAVKQNLCFSCSQKNRLCFRNERTLYNRKCDFSGESIISVYAPDKPYKVYKNDYWYSDKWDPLEYGQEFDFSRPFFEQYHELQLKVPRNALLNINGTNSDYCNYTYSNKNCYLIFGGDFNEDSMFGTLCMHNQNVLDCDYSNDSKFSYMLNDAVNCYECQFVFDSKNCTNCYFISDCTNCTECILCTNLNNKSYCINNIQLSKEEYFQKKQEFMTGGFLQQQKNFQDFLELRKKRIVKYSHTLSCEHCSGDYLKNSKDCQNCYDASDSQDLYNVFFAAKARDSFDASLLGDNAQLIYNTVACMQSYNIRYCYFVIDGSNLEYCEQIHNSQDLFGCISLRRKQYCILNKQYSKEEFEDLRKKIIDHMKRTREWGQFFPKKLSCFGYNESPANEHYPMSKEEALKQGFLWYEKDQMNRYEGGIYEIPDNIKDVPEQITKQILLCSDCKKNYRIVLKEFEFYKKMRLPIPRNCPDCRHKVRLSMRNPRRLYARMCMKCSAPVQTTYASERPEKVYCEKCYLETVY